MQRLLRFGLLAATAALATAPFAGCLDATEIDVALSSNVDAQTLAQRGVIVQVGSPADIDTKPTTSFTIYDEQDAGVFGDFLIVPSGSIDDHVAIRVVLGVGQTSESCATAPTAPGSSCIEARRVLPFARHTKLALPIDLDTSCLGVSCGPGDTCELGQCVGDTIDPGACDGGTCEPPTDASPPTDATKANDACAGTLCGGQCVDLANDALNCGACGFGCSGGTCLNGVCRLDTTPIVGRCLASHSNEVLVTTDAGVYAFSKSGGSGVLVPASGPATAAASLSGGDVSWFEPSTGTQPPRLFELQSNLVFAEPADSIANELAMSPVGWAFADRATGQLYFQSTLQSSATTVVTAPTASVPANWVALTSSIVFGSMGGHLCRYATPPSGASPVCLPNASMTTLQNVGSVVAYDPAQQSGVLVVDQSSIVARVPDDMTSATLAVGAGTGVAPLTGAIAFAPSPPAVYALAGASSITEIDVGPLGGKFSKLVATTSAVPACIAVDDAAVYWLETAGGLYKVHR